MASSSTHRFGNVALIIGLAIGAFSVAKAVQVGRFDFMERELTMESGAGPDAFPDGTLLLVSGLLNVKEPMLTTADASFRNVFLVRSMTEQYNPWRRRNKWRTIARSYDVSDAASVGGWHVTPGVLLNVSGGGERPRPGLDYRVPPGWQADGSRLVRDYDGHDQRRTYTVWRAGDDYTVVARKSGSADLVVFDPQILGSSRYAFMQEGAITSPSQLHDQNLRTRWFGLAQVLGFFLAQWTAFALWQEPQKFDSRVDRVPLGPLFWAALLTGALELVRIFFSEGMIVAGTALAAIGLAALVPLLWRQLRVAGNSGP